MCLQQNLRKYGSELIFNLETPENAVKQIFEAVSEDHDAISLYYNLDYGCGAEEEASGVEQQLSQLVENAGMKLLNARASLPWKLSPGCT